MSLVKIKFSQEMGEAAISGNKCCTTRSETKGRPGDEFEIDGARFRILDVGPATLGAVRDQFYRLEGCESPEAFVQLWQSLHRGHFSESKVYQVHFFARCS
jgi:hypothetical protein